MKMNVIRKIRLACLVPVLALASPLAVFAGPVDVNSADAETISAELKGVGLSKAAAIVAYRKANGPFKSADDLARVKGIGPRTVEINRKDILLRPAGGKAGK